MNAGGQEAAAAKRPESFWPEASALLLGAALPVAMVFANKSAPLLLVLAALAAGVERRALLRALWASLGEGHAAFRGAMTAWPVPVLLAFVLWAGARAATGPFPLWQLARFSGWVAPVLAGLALALVWRKAPPRGLPLALTLGVGFAALLALVDLSLGLPMRKALGARAESFAFNRSTVTLVLLMPALAMGAVRADGGWRRAGALGALGLVIALVARSDSGAAAFGLAAGIAAAVIAAGLGRRTGLVLAAAAVLALSVAPWHGMLAAALMPEALVSGMADSHADDRIAIWQVFGEAARLSPMFGWGFDISTRLADVPASAAVMSGHRVLLAVGHAHNALLQLWVDLGAIGAGLGALGLAAAGGALARRTGAACCAGAGLFGAAFAIAAVSHGAWQPWWTAVLFAAILSLAFAGRDGSADAAQNGATGHPPITRQGPRP